MFSFEDVQSNKNMAQRRKLQVFVSSTFTDLKEERQAAVEAILTAGHIPAGMELFAAGDESQMAVIRRWIDESDAYLLLLGGRYGSIEPITNKSYTHLEYEYAVEKGKALFALVISDEHLAEKNKKEGMQVLEMENPQQLKLFKAVVTSKLVKFWSDRRDILLAIMQTLSDFDRRTELIGWVPGNEATDSGAIAEEIARLGKENADLRAQISQAPKDQATYNSLNFDEMFWVLVKEELSFDNDDKKSAYNSCFQKVAEAVGNQKPSALHVLWTWVEFSDERVYDVGDNNLLKKVMNISEAAGIVDKDLESPFARRYLISTVGRNFFLRLDVERNLRDAKQAVNDLKLAYPMDAQMDIFYACYGLA